MSNRRQLRVPILEIAIGAVLVAAPVALVGVALAQLLPALAGPLVTGALALVGAGIGGWIMARQPEIEHLSGSQFFSEPTEAGAVLAGLEGADADGIQLGGVRVSRSGETRHFHIFGLPGAGKTVMLRNVIQQLVERGDRVLIHDPKGDFASATPGAVLLGPWDERASAWAVAEDFDSWPLMDELAAILCRVEDSGQNRFFHAGAAAVLAAAMKAAADRAPGGRWTWAAVAAELARPPREFIRFLASFDSSLLTLFPATSRGAPTPNGEAGILSTLAQPLRLIAALARVEGSATSSWSARRWMTDADGAQIVLLNNHAGFSAVAADIFGAMLARAAAIIASDLPEVSASAPGIWYIIDEAPQLGAQALRAIGKIAEVGRSRGARVVFVAQDESQYEAAMKDRAAGQAVLAMASTRVYFRLSPEAAQAVARRAGQQEVRRFTSIQESGAVGGKSAQVERRDVLLPGWLTELPRGQFVLDAHGHYFQLAEPYPGEPARIAPAFVPSSAWARPAASAAPAAGEVAAAEDFDHDDLGLPAGGEQSFV